MELRASAMLAQEALGLFSRLEEVKSFALFVPRVPAAALSPKAERAIERYLSRGRSEFRGLLRSYLNWIKSDAGRQASPENAQRRLTLLRLRFNAVLTQFDIFSDVLTQRSELGNGIWLSGLDRAAADALKLPGNYFEPPPIVCQLDRGQGGAIRRQRTRLPGGGENPVAIIRIPRERMIGSGIASSLVHEVGHQGSVLLDLINSIRPVLRQMQDKGSEEAIAWRLYERWISEILADFWSVAKVGVSSTLGLMSLVSLPRAFVFRLTPDGPHPIPWIRVKLSCAIGRTLYPHSQWDQLSRLWERYYPRKQLSVDKKNTLERLERAIPAFVTLLVNHRPKRLLGKSLIQVLSAPDRHPKSLQSHWEIWRTSPGEMFSVSPTMAFAIVGQAKVDGKMNAIQEREMLTKLFTHWALKQRTDRHHPVRKACACTK